MPQVNLAVTQQKQVDHTELMWVASVATSPLRVLSIIQLLIIVA